MEGPAWALTASAWKEAWALKGGPAWHLQGERYTVGGSEIFDNLTDLVEHFKKTGIEEASGAFVYLRQVRGRPGTPAPPGVHSQDL